MANREDDRSVARMENDIVCLEKEMDGLEREIQRIQSENSACKQEIENLLETDDDRLGPIEMGILGIELLALKIYLTTLVKEEIHCKDQLRDRTDRVLHTAYELHALLKQQLAKRQQQLAEAQARLERATIAAAAVE